jgi:YtxH-like protein
VKVLDRQRLRAFLLGGVAGVLAGVIFAPRSGRELRGSIADRAEEARERSRETLFEAQERLQERRSAAREGPRRPQAAPDPVEGVAGLGGTPLPDEPVPERPRLREVPRDVPGEAGAFGEEPFGEETGREAERSEELRRKVRETRARLRGRLDGGPGPAPPDPGADR